MAIRVPSGDLYADLGVSPAASADEISASFRRRARELHPDTNPDAAAAEQFKVVSAAYRVLSDPAERSRYDASRVARSPQPARATPAPRYRPATEPRPRRRASVDDLPPQPMLFGWEMTRRRARWILGAAIACLVAAVVVAAWVLADPGTTAGDETARDITLWIVVAKLSVGGVLAAYVGTHRLRDPLP